MWDMFFLRVPRYLCLHLNALQQAMTYYVNSRMALKIFLKNKENQVCNSTYNRKESEIMMTMVVQLLQFYL